LVLYLFPTKNCDCVMARFSKKKLLNRKVNVQKV
jgi:hypothetical protein